MPDPKMTQSMWVLLILGICLLIPSLAGVVYFANKRRCPKFCRMICAWCRVAPPRKTTNTTQTSEDNSASTLVLSIERSAVTVPEEHANEAATHVVEDRCTQPRQIIRLSDLFAKHVEEYYRDAALDSPPAYNEVIEMDRTRAPHDHDVTEANSACSRNYGGYCVNTSSTEIHGCHTACNSILTHRDARDRVMDENTNNDMPSNHNHLQRISSHVTDRHVLDSGLGNPVRNSDSIPGNQDSMHNYNNQMADVLEMTSNSTNSTACLGNDVDEEELPSYEEALRYISESTL